MRPAPAMLLTVLIAATFVPVGQEPAEASCAAPYLIDVDDVLPRQTIIEIDGAAFANGCQDLDSCTTTLGCSRCDYGPEPTLRRDIALMLRQRGRTWPLGEADAGTGDGLFSVTWMVIVPTEVKIGRATLIPEHGD